MIKSLLLLFLSLSLYAENYYVKVIETNSTKEVLKVKKHFKDMDLKIMGAKTPINYVIFTGPYDNLYDATFVKNFLKNYYKDPLLMYEKEALNYQKKIIEEYKQQEEIRKANQIEEVADLSTLETNRTKSEDFTLSYKKARSIKFTLTHSFGYNRIKPLAKNHDINDTFYTYTSTSEIGLRGRSFFINAAYSSSYDESLSYSAYYITPNYILPYYFTKPFIGIIYGKSSYQGALKADKKEYTLMGSQLGLMFELTKYVSIFNRYRTIYYKNNSSKSFNQLFVNAELGFSLNF